MTNQDTDLAQFAAEIHEETQLCADGDSPDAIEDAFASLMISQLVTAGEIDDGEVCRHRATGVEVSGYHADLEEGRLDLFITIHTGSVPPVTVTKDQIETAMRRLHAFLTKSRAGYASSLPDASPESDMARSIFEMRTDLYRVRLFVLTDGLTTLSSVKPESSDGLDISTHIWDLRRLYRCVTSGQGHEPIEIDFVARYEHPIPCLPAPRADSEYQAYLAIIPGTILASLYGEYGPRLLELNVRSFLQARGKVNRGIRDTILNEPERFLAYNNGISATADEIHLVAAPDGGTAISWARGLQIVNGGQTTASIYQAAKKDRADISRISVQAKLSVVDPVLVKDVIPLISRYANSQNSVNEADFSANDPFHVKLEELSRSIWAPAVGSGQRQTRWFYERARGQFLDARSRARTVAQRKTFDAENPRSQMFTKTDLAKFESTWDQLPHIVSRGAQKNFAEYTVRLRKRGAINVDAAYFHRLAAKAILFRRAERIVQSLNLGGYRANVVAYSIGYIAHKTSQRIDLDRIWRDQGISLSLQETLTTIAPAIYRHLVEGASGKNVTEWCKADRCWGSVTQLELDLSSGLSAELMSRDEAIGVQRAPVSLAPDAKADIERVKAIPSETWYEISKWAKDTNNLASWQRSLSFSLGRIAKAQQEPSPKQAKQGVLIFDEAARLGFKSPLEEG